MIEGRRAALIVAGSVLVAGTLVVGGLVVAVHRGVEVRGVQVRAESVSLALGAVVFGHVNIETRAFTGTIPEVRVSFGDGKVLVDVTSIDVHAKDASADSAAESPPVAHDVVPVRLRVEEAVVAGTWRGRPVSASAHEVVVDRASDGALALHARDAMATRGGVRVNAEGIDGARDRQRHALFHVNVVHVEAVEDASEPEIPKVARDSFDIGSDVAATVMLRGRERIARVLSAVPFVDGSIDEAVIDKLPALPGVQLHLQHVTVSRKSTGLQLRLDVSGAPDAVPEVLDMTVDEGASRIVVDAHGGPLRLAVASQEEAEIAVEGHADLDLSAKRIDARGALRVSGLRVQRAWLGASSFTVDGALGGHVVLEATGAFRLDEGSFELGRRKPLRGHLTASGDMRDLRVQARATVDVIACDDAVSNLPEPFRRTLGQLRFEGKKSLSVSLSASVSRPDDAVFDVTETGACTATAAPSFLAPAAFDDTFVLTVVGSDGQPHNETFGPGTGQWRALPRISRSFLEAVLTTEDAGFFRHKGVSWGAIRSALVDDLKAKRFVRGGSTITMQLAKNLFLTREKNLGRKLEEVLLTDYLEDAFGKERILELYANIVELGPDVFGVEAASQHYFGVGSDELTVLEGLWLATLLPNPKERGHARADGSLSPGKLQELRFLARKARDHGWFTDDDVADAEAGEVRLPRLAGSSARIPGLGIEPPPRTRPLRAIEGP